MNSSYPEEDRRFAQAVRKLFDNSVRIGLRKLSDNCSELWIICKEKNYCLLEEASDLSIDYTLEYKKDIYIVFVTEEQCRFVPEFLFEV